MSHWKIGVKILCIKSWEGQNSMKAKIWGSIFYFFLVEPLVKILCSLKRGVKILYFFPVPWKRGVKTAEPTNQLHWRGAPPPRDFLLLDLILSVLTGCQGREKELFLNICIVKGSQMLLAESGQPSQPLLGAVHLRSVLEDCSTCSSWPRITWHVLWYASKARNTS